MPPGEHCPGHEGAEQDERRRESHLRGDLDDEVVRVRVGAARRSIGRGDHMLARRAGQPADADAEHGMLGRGGKPRTPEPQALARDSSPLSFRCAVRPP